MDYAIYVLAQDPSGQIIEDRFLTGGGMLSRPDASYEAQVWCGQFNLKRIDYDGPFWEPFFSLRFVKRKPRWETHPPSGISASRWSQRIRRWHDPLA